MKSWSGRSGGGPTAWAVVAVFLAGALVRLALLRFPRLWYDEATVGIMGLIVLRGEWPIYFTGQPFMGALDAYLAAPVYFALGASARSLELMGVLVALAWNALLLRLAWEAFGPRAALLTGVWLVLPPDYLLYWSHEGRPVYLLSMVLGTLALLLALRAPILPPGRAAVCFALLGAVLGVAFWTNFLTLVYFPAVAVVLLLRGLRPHHWPSALAAGPAFVLGSLPHWLYGVPHGTALPPSGGHVGLPDFLLHVTGLARGAWPLLTGVPVGLRGTLAGEVTMVPSALRLRPGGVLLATALLAVYGIAAVAAARRLGRPRSVAGGAAAGLLVLVLVNLGVALGTPYGRTLADDARYLVPLYTALPVLAGAWLARLPPAVGAALAAGLVLVHAADAATGSFRNLSPAVAAGERAVLQTQLDTVAALERLGLTRLYAPDFGTRVMTFLSRERVIFSNHYEEIYPPYVLAVDGAERAGWWMSGRDPLFDANLAALGVQASFQWASPLGGAFTDFVLRAPPVRELDPARWHLTASANGAVAPAVADRDAGTLWSSGRPKQGGEWLAVDLGAVEPVALVRWLPGTYQEVPGGLVLEVSRDGESWQRAIELPAYIGPLYWSAGRPMGRVRAGRVELRLPGTAARHLRITQTGANRLWPWTVRELHVYAAAGPAPAPPIALDGPALARELRAAGVTRLYADHGWGARAALADPALHIVPANIAVDAYNFPGSARDFLAPVHWSPGSGILAEAGDVPGIVAVLRAAGLGHAARAIGPLTLLAYAAPPVQSGRAVDRDALAVTASREPGRAARAVDGDPATRWATAHPQTPGDWVRVDLDRPRLVRAVRLLSANPMDQPRGLLLEGSEDGAAWRPLAAETHREGPLRWAGIALLRDGTEALRLDVAPVRARALRLTLTAGHPVFDWSIHELTVYAED